MHGLGAYLTGGGGGTLKIINGPGHHKSRPESSKSYQVLYAVQYQDIPNFNIILEVAVH